MLADQNEVEVETQKEEVCWQWMKGESSVENTKIALRWLYTTKRKQKYIAYNIYYIVKWKYKYDQHKQPTLTKTVHAILLQYLIRATK